MRVSDEVASLIKEELKKLDESNVVVDGKNIKPCNCYYFDSNPLHVLYNINCPESLKREIERIIKTYIPDVESSTFRQAKA